MTTDNHPGSSGGDPEFNRSESLTVVNPENGREWSERGRGGTHRCRMHNGESASYRLPAITEFIRLNWYHSRFTAQISSAIRSVFQSFLETVKMHRTLTNFLVLSALTWVTDAEAGYKSSIISDNQIYFSKAPRFIKFDSKDDEVEIELGVSIPVVKVPLSPPVGRAGKKKESGVTVSAPGLVVAGVLMLTTFLIVPLLFSKKIYRSGKNDDAEDVWNLVKQVENGFHTYFLDSPSCMENLICWTTKATKDGRDGTLGKWMDDVLRSKWMERLVNGTFAENAILAGRSGSECWEKYSCPALKKLQNIVKQQKKAKKQT